MKSDNSTDTFKIHDRGNQKNSIPDAKPIESQTRQSKNPYIRAYSLHNYDLENIKLFISFNTKPDDEYHLQHYNYFSANLKKNFSLQNYLKFNPIVYKPPLLSSYLKLSQNMYDFDLDKSKQLSSNEYSHIYRSWDSLKENEIISTKQYKGRYSIQHDFQFFQMMLSQEFQQLK